MCINLRRCEFYEWIKPAGEIKYRWTESTTEGTFHCWSTQYEEFETGPGVFAIGIVEDKQGHIHVIHDPEKIKFI